MVVFWWIGMMLMGQVSVLFNCYKMCINDKS